MDTQNTLLQHFLVGLFSIILALFFNSILNIRWSTSWGRVSFILLFITLLIGPWMKLRKPQKVSTPLESPWYWRSEFGIWFTITALLHAGFALSGHPDWSIMKALGGFTGGEGYGLANLLGFIALFWALVLATTSFNKTIKFLGIESWKWLHKFTYVLFYLVSAHLLYFQFFSTYGSGPDWFGWTAVGMMVIVIVLQLSAFGKAVAKSHSHE